MSEQGLRGVELGGVLARLWAQTHLKLESLSMPWGKNYPLHDSLYEAVLSTRGLLSLRASDIDEVHDAYTETLSGIMSTANLHWKWLMRVLDYSEEEVDRVVEAAFVRSIRARRAAVARSSQQSNHFIAYVCS